MSVPESGRAVFVANNIFAKSLWNVSAVYLLGLSHSSSTTNRLRGAALDLVPLAFGSAYQGIQEFP